MRILVSSCSQCGGRTSLTIKEALWVMTRANLGSLSVVNERGKLVGLSPIAISIRENALAGEALKIFDQRNINDLIVVNARGKPVALADSQDLPKLKLM